MMRKRKKRWFLLAVICLFVWAGAIHTEAAPEEETTTKEDGEAASEEILKEFDFDEVDRMLSDIFPEESISFEDLVKTLTDGDFSGFVHLIFSGIRTGTFSVLRDNREAIVHILVIAMIAAVFVNFSHIFTNRQVAETGFLILYLLLITILLKSFGIMIDSIDGSLKVLKDFMKVLCPLYFLATAFSTGSMTSVLFYNLMLILIYLVETVILHIILPMIHVYMMIRILDHLSPEPYLTRFGELLDMIVRWMLKTMLICVAGINVMQGLISPAMDAVRRSGIQKGLEAIPGIGGALGGMTDVILSSVVLIRNGIGAVGAVVCVVICAVPILQIGMMTLIYKLIAAVAEPVSDKRIVSCIASTGDGAVLLLKTVYTSAVLFLLTIVVVAAFGV